MKIFDASSRASRSLRNGKLPHVAPSASPISSRVEIVLEAGPDTYPEAVITDPRREHGWKVALSPTADGHWRAEILLPQEPTLLRYHFLLADGSKILESRQSEGVVEPLFGVWEDREYQLSVYNPLGDPPDWVEGQVLYQIFPDSFARADPASLSKGSSTVYGHSLLVKQWGDLPETPPKSRDFYGGDLRGVIDKLDYLKDLGITAIYFTPIFESPTNHRYDAIDYFKIDPRLGSEADLKELIEKAAELGLRVMLDGVFNHCSKDSLYLKAARADKLSPYYRWFNFKAWPGEWEGWANVKTMPEFVECPEVEQFFFGPEGVANHWLSLGTAGWRTDVTPWLTDEYWRRFRAAVRRFYPEAYLIAEDWGNASHRLLGDSFDATMNYRFGYSVVGWAAGKINSMELDDRLGTLRRDTPPGQFKAQVNLLGSHDTARLATLLQKDHNRIKLAVAFQLAYPGVPMIYYGDETGIEGTFAEDSRRSYPWDNQDQELISFYRKALKVRNSSPALKFGSSETLFVDEKGYAFVRRHETETVLAIFNNSEESIALHLEFGNLFKGLWHALLEGGPPLASSEDTLSINLPPLGFTWLHLE